MRTITLLCVFFLSLSAFAQQDEIVADRPGLADGASTVGDAVFQVETGLNVDSQGDEAVTLPTLLRYGFGNRFELRVESDVLGLHDGDADLAPIAAGFKLKLTEGAMPLSLIGSVQPPSGEGDFRSDGYETGLRLVSDIDLGNDFSLTPNVGVEKGEHSDAEAVFALTLEKARGAMHPFVDMEARSGNGDTSAIFDAGVAWIVRPHTQLDVSAGFDVAGEGYPDWFVGAGVSRRF